MTTPGRFGVRALALALFAVLPLSALGNVYTNSNNSVTPGVVIEDGTGQKLGTESGHPIYTTSGLASGAATAANQTAPQAPVAPGAASATKSLLAGCIYNALGVTFTNGQQGAAQCDASGRYIISVGASALPTGAATAAKQPAIGTAGSASADVITIQGASGMTAVTTQSATQASVAPASAAATKSQLGGCQYNSTLASFTNGQQGSVQCDALGRLIISRPDVRATGQTVNSATSNAAVSVALDGGQGVVAFTISGLTASGATLTAEASNDGGSTWSAVNAISPATGAQATTATADGQYRVNAGGHTNARLRVSATGTGTVTIAYNASVSGGLVALSSPLPAGSNSIGTVATNADGTAGSAVPAKGLLVQGSDGTNARNIATTSGGVVKVDLSATAANATAVKVDGSASTQPVSAASLPLPTGAATAANQTAAQGSKAPGTAATNSQLGGAVFTAAGVTLSDGQQAALQSDKAGGLATVGSRQIVVKGSVTYGQTSYSTNASIGGLVTIATGLPSGTIITPTIRLKTLASNATTNSIQLYCMDANPSSSTITDNSALSINSADVSKVIDYIGTNVRAGQTGGVTLWFASCPRMAVDGSGNIYAAFIAGSAVTFAGTGTLPLEMNSAY